MLQFEKHRRNCEARKAGNVSRQCLANAVFICRSAFLSPTPLENLSSVWRALSCLISTRRFSSPGQPEHSDAFGVTSGPVTLTARVYNRARLGFVRPMCLRSGGVLAMQGTRAVFAANEEATATTFSLPRGFAACLHKGAHFFTTPSAPVKKACLKPRAVGLDSVLIRDKFAASSLYCFNK